MLKHSLLLTTCVASFILKIAVNSSEEFLERTLKHMLKQQRTRYGFAALDGIRSSM